MNVKDGVFFLQRTEGSYLARFKFNADGIAHYAPNFEFVEPNDINKTGENISAIRLTNAKITEGKEIPDVPELMGYDNNEAADDDEFTIMGYPE